MQLLASVISDIGAGDASAQDAEMLASLAPTGLRPGGVFCSDAMSSEQRAALAAGLRAGEAMVRAKTMELGYRINGWSINYRGANFGDDYLLRAAVAMDQIYIVEADEALYPSARLDSCGEVLDGHHRYRIRFEPDGLPPVGAFWSITLYFAQGFLVPNAIDRWSIGDRSPGLKAAADGTLDILVQHEPPDEGRDHWLPAPREPFMLIMRLYHPLAPIKRRDWVPPPVVRLEEHGNAGR